MYKTTQRFICVLIFILSVSLFGCSNQPAKQTGEENSPEASIAAVIDNEPVDAIALSAQSPGETSPAQSPADANETSYSAENPLPDGFVYTTDVVPDAVLEIRYYSTYNFVGTRIDGYLAPVSILTAEAAEALLIASDILRSQGYTLKIFDSYRPVDAVNHFVRWGKDLDDTAMKPYFYPDMDKSQLFSGYISSRSGHSRGSTIDLTIINMTTGKEVDMGGPFDYFGGVSSHGTDKITPEQAANRLILREAMETAGFRAYSMEWWHYTLNNEPYPDTYFNFSVQ